MEINLSKETIDTIMIALIIAEGELGNTEKRNFDEVYDMFKELLESKVGGF